MSEGLEALEQAGVGFDPTTQHLDLSKEEKRRTTALLLAIQAYRELIIKDADYLREADAIARRDQRAIKPARIDEMVDTAIKFDAFIAGKMPDEGPDFAEVEETPPSDFAAGFKDQAPPMPEGGVR